MSVISGVSDLLASLGLDKSSTAGSSSDVKSTDEAKTPESKLRDKLKDMSPEEIEKMVKMLTDLLMKLMPIDSSNQSGGKDDISAQPSPPASSSCSSSGGGCPNAGGGGGGGGCPYANSGGGGGWGGGAGAQGADGRGMGRAGTPDSGRGPWDDFSQTGEGNCASIAVIKSAMDKYGDNMYNSKQSDGNGGFNLELQNGKQVHISQQELAEAKQDARFKGDTNSQGYKDGVLAYAVAAKGKAEVTGQSYSNALQSLGRGEYIPNVAHYLGMKVNTISAAEASTADAAIKTDRGHALAIDNGKTDVYGRKVAFGSDGFDRGTVTYFDLA